MRICSYYHSSNDPKLQCEGCQLTPDSDPAGIRQKEDHKTSRHQTHNPTDPPSCPAPYDFPNRQRPSRNNAAIRPTTIHNRTRLIYLYVKYSHPSRHQWTKPYTSTPSPLPKSTEPNCHQNPGGRRQLASQERQLASVRFPRREIRPWRREPVALCGLLGRVRAVLCYWM